jgi:hydroxymethylpyrimidine pyrophosphatase-like HAD family hydrolase
MRYLLLATDYDGTLAKDGRVDEATLAALERLRATGRRLVLVTGRELAELLEIFTQIQLFDLVVAENGALLYRPATKEERVLAEPPPPLLVQTLRKRGVAPLSVGKVIIAGWKPNETTMLEIIRDLGLEMQVIFNKDAVMVLPSGVNKATGLARALVELELSAHEVVGVGDAENDHAFLTMCACSVAVANALQPLKDKADLVTRGDHGKGVVELIDLLVKDDLKDLEGKLSRHNLELGQVSEDQVLSIKPFGSSVLIAGPSGSGKSTAATSFLERLGEHRFQYCIVDPEGDYENLEGALTIGTTERGPALEEVLQALANPEQNVVVGLLGLHLSDRPPFFLKLLPLLLEMRSRTGRPHWILLDEAHHLLPASWQPGPDLLPRNLERFLMITVHPDQIAAAALENVDTVIAVGERREETLRQFSKAAGKKAPRLPGDIDPGKVVVWLTEQGFYGVEMRPSKIEHRRHSRKYAVGELPPEASFYFKGPEGKLNLRAQNLFLFLQIADGIDEATWLHHLRAGDYSRWFREHLKDEVLAREAAAIEEDQSLDARESRARLRALIERYYTWPAAAPPPLPMPGTAAAPVH